MGPNVEEPSADPRPVLTDILARDGRAQSATTVERGDAPRDLREAVLRYQDALPVFAQHYFGQQRMLALDNSFERWLPGITAQPAYPHLRGQVALRWVDGEAPKTVIDSATWFRGKDSLTESDDPAAVLSWRIATSTPPSRGGGPLPWLPEVPSALQRAPDANEYLAKVALKIRDLSKRVASQAPQQGTAERTPWQRALPPDTDNQLIGDLAVWRAAQGVPATDPSPTGPPMTEPDPAKHQARPHRRLTTPKPALSLDPPILWA